MAHTIELGTKHFEPVLVEVEQLATGNTISFIFKDYLDSVTSPYLYTKAPSGITNKLSGTALSSPSGAAFKPSAGTFIEEGIHTGTIEWIGPDGGTYSFPIVFRSYKNTAARKVTKSAEARTLSMNESYSVALGGSTFGGEVFALISDGAYTVAEGVPVLLPDSVNGPLKLEYDSSNTGAEITVTNIGASPYLIPEITFFAYEPVGLGYNPMTEALTEMEARTIESVRVSGVASLSRGLSKTCGSFDRMPEADLTLYGRSGNYNTIIKSGIPVDGTWVTDGDAEFSLNLNYRWVVVRALNTTTILNYDQLFARATVYEEAE